MSDYKNYIIRHYNTYKKIKAFLENADQTYFDRVVINGNTLNDKTVSIVMTASNRSMQTYFTLNTISKSFCKNVQVIIVDDSSNDPIMIEELAKYNMHIELLVIKNKFWINPCVNYNIGFRHIRGGKVIVQNAEVCHIDDVVNYVANNIQNNEYHAFNVSTLPSMDANKKLHLIDPIFANANDIISLSSGWVWYQHPLHRNAYYHFLVAMTKETFDKIGGFDIDYSMGIEYDDNEFVFKARTRGITMKNVIAPVMGVHQWHAQAASGSHSNNVRNQALHQAKCNYFEMNKSYMNFTNMDEEAMSKIVNEWIH
jgi:glycosyltransferase involved in cell wall biosynthesis